MVAQAEDELTLRNIVRASERFPLHFTAFSEVNGNVSLSVGAGIDASFVKGTQDKIAPGLSGGLATNPSFKAGVLNTEKFQRGIQQPVNPETIGYYLDAGWPDELIMALFIERLDLYKGDALVGKLLNEPDKGYGFGALLCHYALTTTISHAARPLGALDRFIGTDRATASPSDLRKEAKEFAELVSRENLAVNDGQLSYQAKASVSLRLSPIKNRCAPDATRTSLPLGFSSELRGGVPVLKGEAIGEGGLSFYDRNDPAGAMEAGAKAGAYHIEIAFRSVQDIIYFLGEYVREADNGYSLPYENYSSRCRNLAAGTSDAAPIRQGRWIMKVKQGAGDALLETKFRRERYFVPVEPDDACVPGAGRESRTMQVVALIQQLLNLHKSSEDLPRSVTITGLK